MPPALGPFLVYDLHHRVPKDWQLDPDAMMNRPSRQIIVTAARAAGVPLDLIQAGLATMEGERSPAPASTSILVNQATAARLLSVSRFTIRRIVAEGILHPVRVRGAIRYSRAELEAVARGQVPTLNVPR